MFDAIMLIPIVVCFALATAYASFCDRLLQLAACRDLLT